MTPGSSKRQVQLHGFPIPLRVPLCSPEGFCSPCCRDGKLQETTWDASDALLVRRTLQHTVPTPHCLHPHTVQTPQDLINSRGWIPREVILGEDARSHAPEDSLLQDAREAAPPTLLLPIMEMARLLQWTQQPGAEVDDDLLPEVWESVVKCEEV